MVMPITTVLFARDSTLDRNKGHPEEAAHPAAGETAVAADAVPVEAAGMVTAVEGPVTEATSGSAELAVRGHTSLKGYRRTGQKFLWNRNRRRILTADTVSILPRSAVMTPQSNSLPLR